MVKVSYTRAVSVAARATDCTALRKPEGALPTVAHTGTIGARRLFRIDHSRMWMFAMGPGFKRGFNSVAGRRHYHGTVPFHHYKECACKKNLL